MGLKIGIVGLPNAGKSSLFNLLTQSNVKVGNFPFSTIQSNIGIARFYDSRMNQLAKIANVCNIVPSTIKFIDIAGLIRGSHKGEGLGNQFLNKIRETQAIAQVVRCFKNSSVSHISNNIQPIQDIEIVNTELALSDIEICEKNIKKLNEKKNGKQNYCSQISSLKKCISHLNRYGELRSIMFNNLEKKYLKNLNFLTMKPIIYIFNIDKYENKNDSYINEIKSIFSIQKKKYIKICAISQLNNVDKTSNIENSYIDFNKNMFNLKKIIRNAYEMLNLHTYFTINKKEIRAWNIPIGTSVIKAAKKIHTDFKRKFISAKIIHFSDFLSCNGEIGAKQSGKIQYKGKNHIIKDGDIIKFIIRN